MKISTGEPGGHNFLSPNLIKNLVKKLDGTIVECNTAYAGRRNTSEEHWKAIKEHGFLDIANVDIMDENGDMAAEYGIRNIPTVLFFKNGEIVDKQVGAVAKSVFAEKVKKLL